MFLYQAPVYHWLHPPVGCLEPPVMALSLGWGSRHGAEEKATGASVTAAPEEQQAGTLQTKTPTAHTLWDELSEG